MKSIDELRAILSAERRTGKRIRIIAPLVGILRWREVPVGLSAQEWERIIAARDAARADTKRVLCFLPRGYEIAWWHMVMKTVRRYEDSCITDDDLIAISMALVQFKIRGNFNRHATLLHICKFIGAEPILPDYSDDDLDNLVKALQDLQEIIV